ncbi:MAG: AAA family ATPase [Propionibacteriaceae bacterium]|jgi:transitional endoplasmic reticulum ATPase|nr:AAA family ATPase [Propionibacteriaceae bacterium]
MPTNNFVGTPAKVIHVDVASNTAHLKYLNGNIGRISNLRNLVDLSPGEVILQSDTNWELAPKESWYEATSIAIVRKVLDDLSVLVDHGLNLTSIPNRACIPVAINNTIEFTDTEGLIRVISEEPITSGILNRETNTTEFIRKEYLVELEEGGLSFSDFGGYPEVKSRALELIKTQLDHREALDAIGAKPVKGILFTGPPGTGKTHLARIIAHESKADFFLVSGPAIVSKWLGDSEGTLRALFEAATGSESGRAIIFFDEIDSIAENRAGDTHESSRRLVAQLLALMDGFEEAPKGVIVIAATNRADALDPALTRPGRFDWEIEFGMPSLNDRLEILQVGASQVSTIGNLPLTEVAALTEGWSAAELSSMWTEAALVAAKDERKAIAGEDLAWAFERVQSRPRQ